jgi:hypothetical protein
MLWLLNCISNAAALDGHGFLYRMLCRQTIQREVPARIHHELTGLLSECGAASGIDSVPLSYMYCKRYVWDRNV